MSDDNEENSQEVDSGTHQSVKPSASQVRVEYRHEIEVPCASPKQVFQADTPGRWPRFKWMVRLIIVIFILTLIWAIYNFF